MSAEITLSLGQRHLVVAPFGASLRRYYRVEPNGIERDILWGYSGAANKKGGQGDVLIPFPGRIRDGRYRFEDLNHQLKLNDKDGPNAIHGFVRDKMWPLGVQTSSSVEFCFRIGPADFEGYPFSLEIRVGYSLTKQGLLCEFSIKNIGKERAPAAAGFHPYFTVGTASVNDAEVYIPANQFIEFDAGLLPTGKILSAKDTPWDFREWRRVRTAKLNHCYTGFVRDAEGVARIGLRDPRTGVEVTVWMDRAFSHLVVYTGDAIVAPYARKALAIEPMTCATDAFNYPDWGLTKLEPGECIRGKYGVTESL